MFEPALDGRRRTAVLLMLSHTGYFPERAVDPNLPDTAARLLAGGVACAPVVARAAREAAFYVNYTAAHCVLQRALTAVVPRGTPLGDVRVPLLPHPDEADCGPMALQVLSALDAAVRAAAGGVSGLDAEVLHGGTGPLQLFSQILNECHASLRTLRLPADLQRLRLGGDSSSRGAYDAVVAAVLRCARLEVLELADGLPLAAWGSLRHLHTLLDVTLVATATDAATANQQRDEGQQTHGHRLGITWRVLQSNLPLLRRLRASQTHDAAMAGFTAVARRLRFLSLDEASYGMTNPFLIAAVNGAVLDPDHAAAAGTSLDDDDDDDGDGVASVLSDLEVLEWRHAGPTPVPDALHGARLRSLKAHASDMLGLLEADPHALCCARELIFTDANFDPAGVTALWRLLFKGAAPKLREVVLEEAMLGTLLTWADSVAGAATTTVGDGNKHHPTTIAATLPPSPMHDDTVEAAAFMPGVPVTALGVVPCGLRWLSLQTYNTYGVGEVDDQATAALRAHLCPRLKFVRFVS